MDLVIRWHTGLFAALGLALAAGILPPGSRAWTAVQAEASTDTVRGVVFDSLTRGPLAGASVIADPGGESAITDERGQFQLISTMPVRRLSVFHGLLDQTGIGSLSAVIGSAARVRSVVMIGTPSLATIWARLCPGLVRDRGREHIVFGAARTADGSTRVAGVRVRASWDSDSTSRLASGTRVVDARTDSIGTFYVCGVPANTDVFLIGYSVELSSGSIGLPGNPVPLRRQDLILGAPGETGTVRGVVQSSRRTPVAGASIDVDGLDKPLTTDATGRFSTSRAPAGTRSILVRAVGFSPVLLAVDVLRTGGDEVHVELDRNVFLPGVKVTERTRAPVLRQEFEERRHLGIGQFIDNSQIRDLHNVRSIFQGRPGVTVQGNQPDFTLYVTANAGYCQPAIFLDGFRSDTQVLAAMNKDRIAGVEIYLRPIEIPARYAVVQRGCGAVLVWTKDAFSR